MAVSKTNIFKKSRLIGIVLASQMLASCTAATTVGGFLWDIGEGTVDIITGTFEVIGYLIPDGDPPPPPGGDDDVSPATGRPYQIAGRWYYPAEDPDYDEVGFASWYGPNFHGRPVQLQRTLFNKCLGAWLPPRFAKYTRSAMPLPADLR